jgi:hypothetical protein
VRTVRLLAAAAAAATALTLVGSTPAIAGKGPKPGPVGPIITLGGHVQDLTGGATDMVMSHNGTAYAAWITSNGAGRVVNACVLPRNAKACKGGIQSAAAIDIASAADLHMLMVDGTPTLYWLIHTLSGGAIATATFNSAGVLSSSSNVAPGPDNGVLFDVVVGPDKAVWLLTAPAGLPKKITVRDGLNGTDKTIKTPWPVGFASLAFSGHKPIIVGTDYGAILTPVAFSMGNGSGSYTAFKNVKGTGSIGTNIGLKATSSGVRLITGINNANYWPVVAKWNGHGFGHPVPTGDKNPCAPDSHDVQTDGSGRLVDVTNECGQVTVSNLPDATHASVLRFPVGPSGSTGAGNSFQIVSSPRGYAWVMWGIEAPAPQGGVKLMVRRVLLGDRHKTKTAHGKHGKVTVIGPASCLTPFRISVGVKGHPDHGWKVGSKSLRLNGKKIGSSINGAALTPGKKYTLAGTVVFTGGGHEKVTAKLIFRACPAS